MSYYRNMRQLLNIIEKNCVNPQSLFTSNITDGAFEGENFNYGDVIMSAVASQITSLTIVYSVVYPGADQRKHQSSASLAFVRGIHRWPVNSPHKGPITRKMFPFDDVIMEVDWLSLKGGHCHLSLLLKRDVKDTHFNTFTRTTWQSTTII